jgi:hypothetical protein
MKTKISYYLVFVIILFGTGCLITVLSDPNTPQPEVSLAGININSILFKGNQQPVQTPPQEIVEFIDEFKKREEQRLARHDVFEQSESNKSGMEGTG